MIKKYQFLKDKIEEKYSIIFLDIDGVIQPYSADDRFKHDMKKTLDFIIDKYNDEIYNTMDIHDVCAAYYDWDELAIGIIKKIVQQCNCKIIMHSGWIEYNNLDQIKALFKLYNLDEYIIDITNPKVNKIDAINEYLELHKEIDNYVIIDDHDMTLNFGEHFVNTNNVINMEDYNQVISILNNKYKYEIKDNKVLCMRKDCEMLKFEYTIRNIKDKNVLYLDMDRMDNHFSKASFKVFLNYILKYFKSNYDITCCVIININYFIDEKENWTSCYSQITNTLNEYTKMLFIDTVKNGMSGYRFINDNKNLIIDNY